MDRLHEEGFFEVVLPSFKQIFRYQLKKQLPDGSTTAFWDSYSFLPMLTEFDTYLFNAGDHHRAYEKLGAHYAEVDGVGGIQFSVWAPGARSVSVIGDFNDWDRRRHAVRVRGA